MSSRNNSFLLASLSALLIACGGSSVSNTVPELPKTGTDNLDPNTGGKKVVEAPVNDLWAGHDLIEPPRASAAKALKLPTVDRFTLKNGLQVIAIRDESLPVVNYQVALRAGRRDEPRDKAGIAEFAASMLSRGTRLRNAARIAKEIEAVGGSLSATASYEATLLSCRVMSKDSKTCLNLLPDILSNPTFPATEEDIIRRNLHAAVRQRMDDAGQLASAHFQSALWGNEHIRGTVMSSKTVDNIQKADLQAWHKSWLRPNNAILSVSGNIDPSKLKLELERAFFKWKKGTVPERAAQKPPSVEGIKIRLVDKPGQTQSHIRVGHLGLAHKDSDFYAAQVFNYTLGGGQFSSRLLSVVRSKEGKTYSASSSFDRNQEIGAFVAGTFTRTPETLSTIRLVRDEIAKMGESGPTEDELSAAKTNLAGSYAMRFESVSSIASAILAAELHDLSDDYVSNYPLQISKINVLDAKESAARRLDPNNVVIVIVGDGAKIEPQLKEAGWSYEVVGHTEPISDWERNADVAPAAGSDDPKALAEAKAILDAALKAKGGKAKLTAMKTVGWSGEARLNLPQGPVPAMVTKRFGVPDKLRLDRELKMGPVSVLITTVLDGDKGWAREDSPRGKNITDFGPAELKALKGQLWREPELVLIRHLDAKNKVQKLDDQKLDGTLHHRVRIIDAAEKRSVLLWIDAKTKLLSGMDYADQGMNTQERYADYKTVNGIKIAHTRMTKSPQVDLVVNLKSFDLNKAQKPADFARPSN